MKTALKYCIDREEQVLNTFGGYNYKRPFTYETYSNLYGDYTTVICDTLEEVAENVKYYMNDDGFDGNIYVYVGKCEYDENIEKWEIVEHTDEEVAYYKSFHNLVTKRTAQFHSLKEMQRSEIYDYRNPEYDLIMGVFEYDSIDDYLKEEEYINEEDDKEYFEEQREYIIYLLKETELYDLYKKYGSNIPKYSEEYEL